MSYPHLSHCHAGRRPSALRACAQGVTEPVPFGEGFTCGDIAEIFTVSAERIEQLESGRECLLRAEEEYAMHRMLALDNNQPAERRDAHRAAAERAAGIILELFDNE